MEKLRELTSADLGKSFLDAEWLLGNWHQMTYSELMPLAQDTPGGTCMGQHSGPRTTVEFSEDELHSNDH